MRDLTSLGLQVRTQAKMKVRQPLRQAFAIVVDPSLLDGSAIEQLKEELNVQAVEAVPLARATEFVELRVKPSFRSLGARGLGKEAQRLKGSLAKLPPADAALLAGKLLGGTTADFDGVSLERADVEVDLIAKEGFAAAGDRVGVVVLDTKLDEELIDLGLVRELQSRIQGARKEMSLGYADRILLSIETDEKLRAVLGKHKGALASEVLADEILLGPPRGGDDTVHVVPCTVEGISVTLGITRA